MLARVAKAPYFAFRSHFWYFQATSSGSFRADQTSASEACSHDPIFARPSVLRPPGTCRPRIRSAHPRAGQRVAGVVGLADHRTGHDADGDHHEHQGRARLHILRHGHVPDRRFGHISLRRRYRSGCEYVDQRTKAVLQHERMSCQDPAPVQSGTGAAGLAGDGQGSHAAPPGNGNRCC